MNRDEVLDLVKRKASEIIPDLDPASIEGSRSLQEYGASSLDLVELVSAMMRELKVKIPRSELANIKTIDGLVDLLLRSGSSI
ncbi:acyl carrier protein [Methylobacterium sp. WL122]|nr:acyl carrier protein [Methylobacterium sp. WL122]